MRSLLFVVLAVVVGAVALLVHGVQDDAAPIESVEANGSTGEGEAPSDATYAPPVALADVPLPAPTPTREAVVERPLGDVDWTGVKTMLEPGEELRSEAEIDATLVEMVCRQLGWRTDMELPACTLELSCPVYVNGMRDLEMEQVLFDRRGPKFGVTITRLGVVREPGSFVGRAHFGLRGSQASIGPLPPGKYRAVPHLYAWPGSTRDPRFEVVSGLEELRFELTDGVVVVEQPIELTARYATAISIELPPEVVGQAATLVARVVGPFGALDADGAPVAVAMRELSTAGRHLDATHFEAECELDSGAYEVVLLGHHVPADGSVTTFAVCEPFTAEPTTPKTVATRALGGCLWGSRLHESHPRAMVFPFNGYSGIAPPPPPPALTRFGVPEALATAFSIRCPLGVGHGPAWVLVPGLTYAFDPSQSVEAVDVRWCVPVPIGELRDRPEPGPPFTFVAGPPGSTIERE
jgi:hypothetical protein